MLFTVVNFRIAAPSNVTENSGYVKICIEQMNSELRNNVNVDIKTIENGSTASGDLNN